MDTRFKIIHPRTFLLFASLTILLAAGITGCTGFPIQYGSPFTVYQTDILQPAGVVVDQNQNLYVTSQDRNGSVLKISPDGTRTVLAENLVKPAGLVLDRQGQLYISAEIPDGNVYKLSPGGRIEKIISHLNKPEGLALDSAGTLFISEDAETGRLLQFKDGILSVLAEGMIRTENMALGPDNHLYVTETGPDQITRITPDGTKQPFLTGIARADGLCYCETYQGFFAAEDVLQGRIMFTGLQGRTGTVIAHALKFPQGMVCDRDGNLFAAERGQDRILLFNQKDLKTLLKSRTSTG